MIGQLLDRRYRIIKVLGSSEFGQTYLAADTHRPGYPQCVVKQLRPPSDNPRTLQIIELLFKKKAESLEKLGKHEQIPQLLAFFEEDKEFYLVEEFIAGRSLSHEIGQGKPLPEDQVCRLLQEILEILVFVHGHGIIHRDIKPENIIRRTQDNKLVLIDFGPVKEISYQLSKAQRQNGQNGGVEIHDRESLEPSQNNILYNSDLYAVGMIGIQALTGLSEEEIRLLWETSTLHSESPENPQENAPKPEEKKIVAFTTWHEHAGREDTPVLPQLAEIIDKMVHPDPSQRYQSATEVLGDLKKLKETLPGASGRQPGTPTPPPPPPPIRLAPQTSTPNPPEQQMEPKSPEKEKSGLSYISRILIPLAIIGAAIILVGIGYIFYQTYANNRVQELKSRGLERARSGDLSGAIQEFNEAIQLSPKNPETYYNRANAQYDLGNFEAAIKDYTEAIEQNPNNENAYFNRGMAYYELGKYKETVQDYAKVLALNPNDVDAYYKRGLAYHALGNYQAAIEDYTQAIQRNPQEATAYINRGLSQSAAGNKQAAIDDYTQAIRIEPNNADAFYSRGRDRFFMADYQGAMEDYSEAIRLNPENADIHINRCGAYLNLGDPQKAIADCTRGIEINPKDASAYSNRCLAYMNLQQYPEAISDCTQAIGINPKNAKVYSNRGLARHAGGDLPGGIDDFTEAIRLVPGDAVAFNNRGKVYYDMKSYGEALLDFTQAIRLKPNYDNAYYNRALVRSQLGDKEGAIEDFRYAGKLCLDQGKTSCYNEAQIQIKQLQPQP